MLGSDYPFRGALDRCMTSARDAAISKDDRSRILGRTAARWFAPR
jgi:hypothetical protein